MREIVKIFADEGVCPLHENCFNYGGLGFEQSLELIQEVKGLHLLFDTANPAISPDLHHQPPYPRQDAYECFLKLRPYIQHVHIKDNRAIGARPQGLQFQDAEYCYPGKGNACIPLIIRDLISSKYSGYLSIEPHLVQVYHDATVTVDAKEAYRSFIKYGRELESLTRKLYDSV